MEEKGPLIQLTQWLKDNHQIEPEELQAIELAVEQEIDVAVRYADAADIEPVEALLNHVYTEVSHG